MKQFTLICLWCQAAFTSSYDTTLYCCRSHKEQARELRKRKRNPDYKPHEIHTKYCPGCGISFETTNNKKKYCNTECRLWFKEQAKRQRDAEYLNKKTPSFRRRIYFQSNGRCGICNELIDLAIKHPDPQSYSIDHIVPRSAGGIHRASNLQAAHLGCNMKKSNKQ